jgi:hypothetical protein
MNKKSLIYSGILLVALVVTSILIGRGVIQGVVNASDINLTLPNNPATGNNKFYLGQTIHWTSSLAFADQEFATLHQVELIVSGPQGFTSTLPTLEGTYTLTGFNIKGTLIVTVTHTGIETVAAGTTLPGGGTLPGATLPGSGRYKGVGAGAKITYSIDWTPPVFLDPPPAFTLIPDVELLFSIPKLPPAATTTDTLLPATDQKFTIPVVGAPTGTTLPSLDLFFTIPTLSVSSNAATTTPDLPDLRYTTSTSFGNSAGFNIPQLPVTAAPSGINDFPELTEFFTVPTPTTASAPSGVPNMPAFALDFAVSGTTTVSNIHGIATNNSDYWIISDGTGAGGNDQILKLNSSGAITQTIPGPSGELSDIVLLNGFLWVSENLFRCFDTIDDSRCDRSHRIFKFNPDSVPTNTAAWDDLTTIHASGEPGMSIGGLAAEGSGATGSLWIAPKFGGRFFNLTQTGSEQSSPFTDFFAGNMDALAFDGDLLYTSNASGNTITQWTTDGKKVTEFSAVLTGAGTPITGIRGMTFRRVSGTDVLFIGSTAGRVHKGFFAPTVTNTPRGLAYSPSSSSVGEAIWVVVDAEPKDKILRLSATDGTLVTSFDTDGVADAPSKDIAGVAFVSNFLYLISNEGGNAGSRKLYKYNPTTAAVTNTFDLATTASLLDELTAITTDGTNLIVHAGNFNAAYMLTTAGVRTGFDSKNPCCPSYFGLSALGYHSGRTQFFGANSDKVGTYDSTMNFVSQATWNATSSISGVKGIAFNGDLAYVAHATGKVSRSFLGTTVTTRPRGAAFSSSSSGAGRALWVLVDGSPKDRLLKLNPDTGELITTFSDDGAVDAPSASTEGVTYLDTGSPGTSFLWIVANEGLDKKLYKVNATTGAVVTTINLCVLPTNIMCSDLGDITNDGTNLVIHAKTNNEIVVLDTTGAFVERTFPVGSGGFFDFGATGLGRHSGRAQYFTVKSDKLRTISNDRTMIEQEQTLLVDAGSLTNADGISFDQDVAYVAYYTGTQGRVAIGALRATGTNSPRGIAYSGAGSILSGVLIDEAIWVLVDGDPKDKILKLSASTGALLTSFSDDGVVDAPSKNTEGITFLNGFLWVVANESSDNSKKLYKIRATDGVLSQTFALGGVPGGFIDDMGDITNDGTNLLISLASQDRVYVVDTNGARVTERAVCCPTVFGASGYRGIAFRSAGTQTFFGGGSAIHQTIVNERQESGPARDQRIIREFSGLSISGIQGMVFIGDRLYVAHTGSGLVSRAFVPSDTTSNPQGLSYDAGADEFYVLVDGAGKAKDRVVVMFGTSTGTSTSGMVKRSFQAPDDDALDLTYLNGTLYVAVFDEEPPCCAPPVNHIYKLNPTTGAQTGDLAIGYIFDKISALTNDGTNLIAWPETPGLQASFINPSNGTQVDRRFHFDESEPSGFFESGFKAVAFQSSTKQLFPTKNKLVYQFDEDGRKLARFDITTGALFDDIRGASFRGDVLFMAEAGGDTVHSARIPAPPTVVTTDPLGMATDGTNLFILVDATPKDKILKVNSSTGALMASFDAPGADADALAFHQNFLYVVTNDERFFEIPGPLGPTFERRALAVLNKLNPATGAKISEMTIPVTGAPGGFPFLRATVSALASDGTSLYLGLRNGSTDPSSPDSDWFRFNPNTPFSPAVGINEQPGALSEVHGFEAFTITTGNSFPDNRQLIGVGSSSPNNDRLVRMNKDTGAVFQQFALEATTTPGLDIKGLAYVGRTLFLADDAINMILGTALPENTVELTVVGDYGSVLRVSVSPSATLTLNYTTADRPFKIIRNPQVQVKLTSPLPNFVQTSATSTISGLVSDPSILKATVGVLLPFTNIIEDHVTKPASMSLWDRSSFAGGSANWHIACTGDAAFLSDKAVSPSCAWRYSEAGQPNFDIGTQTAGALEATEIFTARDNTVLSFDTWYDTEGEPGSDQKFIEVAVVTKDAAGNDIIGVYRKIAQIVGFIPAGALPPAGAPPSFVFLTVPAFEFGPGGAKFRHIELPLGAFNGQRLKVRFSFDSVDRFANTGLGWFLDDIIVAGSDLRTVEVSTTPITPMTMSGVTYFRSFTTLFELSEGSNLVIASGVQPYSPFLKNDDKVEGFLDSRPPVISLVGVPSPTNQLNQNLQGNVQDLTFDFAELFQTDGAGTRSIGSVTAVGNFGQPVLLSEGKTTFTAVAHDRGGLTSTASLVVIADFTPPTVVDNGPIYPLGAVSARTLDDIIFQVTASDGTGDVSGVASVKLLAGNTPVANLLQVSNLPGIVVDMFGISGNWVQFVEVPPGTPSGRFSIRVRATDAAGNSSETNLFGDITPSLLAQNIFLFGGANLVGINLQNKGLSQAFDTADVLAQPLRGLLDPVFQAGLDSALIKTVASAPPTSTPPVAINASSTVGIDPGDRLRLGSGDTGLTRQANAGSTTLPVGTTDGFSVGQVIAIGAEEGPFGLGVKSDGPAFQTTTVSAVNAAAKLVTTTDALLLTRPSGVRVTGIQHVRVLAVNGPNDVRIAHGFMHFIGGTLVAEETQLSDVISSVFHFTGGLSVGGSPSQGLFLQYVPGPFADDLLTLQQGRSYWFIAKPNAFRRSAPLFEGTQGPIIPVRMQLDGVFFDPTGSPPSLPATFTLAKDGWHMIALIAERPIVASEGVRGVIANSKPTSLVEFQKFIDFDPVAGYVNVVSGALVGLGYAPGIRNDTMQVGRGFFIRLVDVDPANPPQHGP